MFRILTFDGGPATPIYARSLERLEEVHPGFVQRADLFAGTSDGSFLSLFLASPRRGDSLTIDSIRDAVAFVDQGLGTFRFRVPNWLRLLTGFPSAVSGRATEEWLRGEYADLTLGGMQRNVLCVTYRLRGKDRHSGPVLHNNFGAAVDPVEGDHRRLGAVDVALRSGAFPVLMPIRAGHVDGGVFANNPALCAVAAALDSGLAKSLDDIVLLSLGGDDDVGGILSGRNRPDRPRTSWGWLPWMFNPLSPGMLVDLIVSAEDTGVHYQCNQLLGGARYQRLAPPPPAGIMGDIIELMLGAGSRVKEQADRWVEGWVSDTLPQDRYSGGERPSFAELTDWIGRCWMGDNDSRSETHIGEPPA